MTEDTPLNFLETLSINYTDFEENDPLELETLRLGDGIEIIRGYMFDYSKWFY